MRFWILVIVGIFITFAMAKSDQRSFVWTYEYMILNKGEAEIEQYTTFSSTDIDNFEGNMSTELNFESEIGMTEHFDFAIYQNFKQMPNSTFYYSGFKLRGRYKIGKKGDYFFDPLLYLEYKGVPDFQKHEIEAKLILAKDIGKLSIALNPYFEYEIEDDENKFVPKYAIGVRYKFSQLLSFGIEGKGDKDANYIGPTIAHGNHNYWATFGVLYGYGKMKSSSAEFLMRLIVGLSL